MPTHWPAQTVILAFTAVGIALLFLGYSTEIPSFKVAPVVVLVIGFPDDSVWRELRFGATTNVSQSGTET